MKIEATYAELSAIIAAKSGKKVDFAAQGTDTLAITPRFKLGFIPLSPTLCVTVEEIQGSDIKLSYSGGFGVDMIVTGAITFLRKQVQDIDSLADFDGKRTLRIHLDKIAKLAPLFQVMDLTSVAFSADALHLALSPRS